MSENEFRMQIYCISIFTSVIGMAYLTSAVGVVVLAVVLVHIMSFAVLLGWDHPHSLFGKGNYILNRYYSTHTMHVHKMNTYDIALKMLSNNGLSVDDIEKIYKPADPMHWDALGLVIPATDESAQIHRYKVGRTQMKSYNASVCNHGALPACFLENNAGDYLLLNGESLSILSEISPSVYFATLLVVYLLGSIPFVTSYGELVWMEWWGPKPVDRSSEKLLRKGLTTVILVVYFCGLVAAYAGSPFRNVTTFKLEEDVYYSTSSHMASILVCVLTVFLYLLHLRGRNSKWYNATSSVYEAVRIKEITPRAVQGITMTVRDGGDMEQLSEKGGATCGVCSGVVSDLLSVNNTIDQMRKEAKDDSTTEDGPFSSEASVIVAVTIFLGGMGNIGMSRGVVLEVEAQLVLACTLGFAVLEVCSYRLEAYFRYMFGISVMPPDSADDETTYYKGVCFIRFVVLALQLWLLVLYNNTVTEMGYAYSISERSVFALTMLYWSLQVSLLFTRVSPVVSWGLDSLSKIAGLTGSDVVRWGQYISEILFCGISFFVIFGALFGYAMWNGLHTEDKLERYEKLQYGLTGRATINTQCNAVGKYKTVDLVNEQLHASNLGDRDWDDRHQWLQSQVDPIDLKVFFWTKYWNSDLAIQGSMPRWFCSNGFEHHWMQCLNYPDTVPLPVQVTKAIADGIKTF